MEKEKLKYLELLSEQYPNINVASTEIINLQAILNLPKGTEHFISDIHGEFESLNHVLKNASGVIKTYINEIFGNTLRESEKRSLATLIYYPEQKLELIEAKETDLSDWYKITLFRLVLVCKRVSSKYTRSKVRKALPQEFSYIIEELLHEGEDTRYKQEYYNEIIDTIIKLDRAKDFVTAISNVIHTLAIDRLHVIGDIYDRGPGADKILDMLHSYHSVDIQWGNHDISWMGAATGSEACICNVIRITARYNNLGTIEEGYGINLVPLATFAMEYYKDDPCHQFMPEGSAKGDSSDKEMDLIAKMHKAICVLQFKVEAQVIKRHPEYKMDDRLLLDKIDFKNKIIKIGEKSYELVDDYFPTINENDPFELTREEAELISKLTYSFINSPKLQDHARFLFNKGGMYLICNSNLLFHGCVPIDEEGNFIEAVLNDKKYFGKAYLDEIEIIVRGAFFRKGHLKARQNGMDLMWYLWCGPASPLYGKDKMTTFERYFLKDEKLFEESKDPYYNIRNREEVCNRILINFGLDPEKSHIINGHVPVKVSKGESPIKANGKLLVIDGGFAKAYQKVTGIAGYTLIYNSRGLVLASHEPFLSAQSAIQNETDILSNSVPLEYSQIRKKVGDTDDGQILKRKILDLEQLLFAYKKGAIKEKE